MLGPLEAVEDGQLVALGGIKQRATLAFLLLHANRVVASSQLVKALWATDKVPQSARKILQNAVWRLRGVLSSNDSAVGSVALLSQAPGYMLCVEPDQTDLYTFQRLVEEGRAKLVAGSPEAATLRLQEALALWRGPVLADLVETGIAWPELTSIRSARLDAMEDYFEAELACGRHHEVVAELETIAAAEPLRERLCGQLMTALYRCGRQTDALDACYSLRTSLVEKLGLEPGRELQALQQAILAHDPVLLPAGIRQQVELQMTGIRGDRVQKTLQGADPQLMNAGVVTVETPDRRRSDSKRQDERGGESPTVPLSRTVAARKDVSVLIVRTQLSSKFDDADPEKIDEIVENMAAIIRDEVECFGGTVTASIGSIWLALFGVPRSCENDAERAVRAAFTIRDRLSTSEGQGAQTTSTVQGVAVHSAVATGQALVRYEPDCSAIPPSVNGALLDECHSLLSLAPAGGIRVCDNTRRSTEFAITYHRGDSSFGWQFGGFRQECLARRTVPVIEDEYELETLRSLFQRTRHRAMPHLVTVLGESGTGKTRFITAFKRQVVTDPEVAQFLIGRSKLFADANPLSVLTGILSSYCGILQSDSGETARTKLTRSIVRLADSEEEGCWLLSRLSPLIKPEDCACHVGAADALAACRHFLGKIAAAGPLVVVIEDLHRADDVLVDFVENLPTSLGSVPLLVIATARPELLKRRPEWAGGIRHSLTITLEPISDVTIGGPVVSAKNQRIYLACDGAAV